MDARRKVSIDAFIFSPRSQTSDQILQKNIPKLGPKGDLWLQQEKILLLQQEDNILLSQQDFMSGSFSDKKQISRGSSGQSANWKMILHRTSNFYMFINN